MPSQHVLKWVHWNPQAATSAERIQDVVCALSLEDAISLIGTQRRLQISIISCGRANLGEYNLDANLLRTVAVQRVR